MMPLIRRCSGFLSVGRTDGGYFPHSAAREAHLGALVFRRVHGTFSLRGDLGLGAVARGGKSQAREAPEGRAPDRR